MGLSYALKTSSCVNLLLSGGWDSRYVLAHLLDRGGDKTNLRLTTVDHFGEAETALKVAQAAGLELEIITGTPYPDDSFEQPFTRTLEGLSFTKHAANIAAARYPGVPAIQGYLGDSLVRGKNARQFSFHNGMTVREQAWEIADKLRAVARGVLHDDVLQAIRDRAIALAETIVSSPMAAKPAETFDIYGRQRRYIVNNFLQHIETNEVYLPFCSWELVSHYLYAGNNYLNDDLYPEMFRARYAELGNIPRHKNVYLADRGVSKKAREWSRLSMSMMLRRNTSGFLRKWWLLPRIALGPFRRQQFYAIRAVASLGMQLEIIRQTTGDRSISFGSIIRS